MLRSVAGRRTHFGKATPDEAIAGPLATIRTGATVEGQVTAIGRCGGIHFVRFPQPTGECGHLPNTLVQM